MEVHPAISTIISAPNKILHNRKHWIWMEVCHCQQMVPTASLAIYWIKASGKNSKISSINNYKEAFSTTSFSCNLKNNKVTRLLEMVAHLHFIIIYRIEILVFHMVSHNQAQEPTYKKKVFPKLQAQNWIQSVLIALIFNKVKVQILLIVHQWLSHLKWLSQLRLLFRTNLLSKWAN